MDAQSPNKRKPVHKRVARGGNENKRTERFHEAGMTLIGAGIGLVLTSLLGVLVFASIVWSFNASEQSAFQLLNTAITIVGTTLGGALGYLLGRGTNART